ncbi:MAG: Sua5/YciO/YrdC/YwlC family protein [Chlamydiia bacterium]
MARRVGQQRTDCCKTCGHRLQLVDRGLHVIASGQAIDLTREHLKKGLILAIRNTGAFLLLTDAINAQSMKTFRECTERSANPFALVLPTIEKAKEIAYTTSIAEEILTSAASTIV